MSLYFFFNHTATTEIYTDCHTLSLHDTLPIFMEFVSRLDIEDADVAELSHNSPQMYPLSLSLKVLRVRLLRCDGIGAYFRIQVARNIDVHPNVKECHEIGRAHV